MLCKDILVGNGSGEFQIRDGKSAVREVSGDQGLLDRRGEGMSLLCQTRHRPYPCDMHRTRPSRTVPRVLTRGNGSGADPERPSATESRRCRRTRRCLDVCDVYRHGSTHLGESRRDPESPVRRGTWSAILPPRRRCQSRRDIGLRGGCTESRSSRKRATRCGGSRRVPSTVSRSHPKIVFRVLQ